MNLFVRIFALNIWVEFYVNKNIIIIFTEKNINVFSTYFAQNNSNLAFILSLPTDELLWHQVLIWWGDSPCSKTQMSESSATLEVLSSYALASRHSCAQASKFTVYLSLFFLFFFCLLLHWFASFPQQRNSSDTIMFCSDLTGREGE